VNLSMSNRTKEVLSYQRSELHLGREVSDLNKEYLSAEPFPHLMLDNLFPPLVLDGLVEEMLEPKKGTWIASDEPYLKKKTVRNAVDLRERTSAFITELHSAPFLYLISEITGIQGLLPDPYLTGAGPTIVPEGGKFDVHADRNTDHFSGLRRRVAMILYLNKDWSPEYGGQFELWNQDGSAMQKSVEPLFNRIMLFEIGDKNFHAVRPVTKDSGRERRSLLVYYHTVDLQVVLHNSIYAPPAFRTREPLWQVIARETCPPIVHRALRRLRSGG
jgi:Rps23 Pro-64 3,4-dihydroxylase Tpa1-like proline 4-hydroxylase